MIVTMTETIPGRDIVEILGIVRGSTVRARFFVRDITAVVRTVIGGEVPEYTRLMNEARDQALDRLVVDANRIGADAVVNLRIEAGSLAAPVCEVLAYGTAVRLK